MYPPEHFRAKEAECGELTKTAISQDDVRESERRETSTTTLADNAQWLADKMVHSGVVAP